MKLFLDERYVPIGWRALSRVSRKLSIGRVNVLSGPRKATIMRVKTFRVSRDDIVSAREPSHRRR